LVPELVAALDVQAIGQNVFTGAVRGIGPYENGFQNLLPVWTCKPSGKIFSPVVLDDSVLDQK
jgi:hypothetical protein